MGDLRRLKYIGHSEMGSHGLQPTYDTGKVISAVDLATAMGFQAAMVNAPDRRTRRHAMNEFQKWGKTLAIRVGVRAKNATFAVADDGRVLTNVPEIEDEPPIDGGRADA